jgi:hypothetical protein
VLQQVVDRDGNENKQETDGHQQNQHAISLVDVRRHTLSALGEGRLAGGFGIGEGKARPLLESTGDGKCAEHHRDRAGREKAIAVLDWRFPLVDQPNSDDDQRNEERQPENDSDETKEMPICPVHSGLPTETSILNSSYVFRLYK